MEVESPSTSMTSGSRAGQIRGILESWREVVIRVDRVMGWEQDWYPGAVGAAVTAFFVFVWYWDPTLITFVAFLGIAATLADFAVPRLADKVFGGQHGWDTVKEHQFDQACKDIDAVAATVGTAFAACREARTRKPVVHFAATVASLLAMIWIGNRINSLFLAYVVTLGLAMLPGLQRRGILQKHLSQLSANFCRMVKGKDAVGKTE